MSDSPLFRFPSHDPRQSVARAVMGSLFNIADPESGRIEPVPGSETHQQRDSFSFRAGGKMELGGDGIDTIHDIVRPEGKEEVGSLR